MATNVNLKLEGEEEEMMTTLLKKITRFRMRKDAVLVEALRTYYQNQEQAKWRMK